MWGADVVMHSGTKYIGGHSDMLCGILATRKGNDGYKMAKIMRAERIFLGAVLGSLEGWLGVRSLRTLELRVQRQSSNADRLVSWLLGALTGKNEDQDVVSKVVNKVVHASLQTADFSWLKKQMPNGFGPVFSIFTHTSSQARSTPFPSSLVSPRYLTRWRPNHLSNGGGCRTRT